MPPEDVRALFEEIVDDNPSLPDNPAPGNQNGPAGFEPTECTLKERGEFAPPLDAGFTSPVDVIQDPQVASLGTFDDTNAQVDALIASLTDPKSK